MSKMKCPHCGSHNTEVDEFEPHFDDEYAIVPFYCHNCGTTWNAVYEFKLNEEVDVLRNVLNAKGEQICFEAAVNLMDRDIAEELHTEGIESDQEFIERYAKAHEEKFGEEFAPYVGGAW